MEGLKFPPDKGTGENFALRRGYLLQDGQICTPESQTSQEKRMRAQLILVLRVREQNIWLLNAGGRRKKSYLPLTTNSRVFT